MKWYKLSPGLAQNAKLAVIARRTGLRRGEMLALWIALMDHASEASERGSVQGIDPEEIAATLEFDPAAVKAAIIALRDREMILPDGMLSGWSRHQKLSTQRTRAHRARVAAARRLPAEETDEARRQRLQFAVRERHQQQGYALARQH